MRHSNVPGRLVTAAALALLLPACSVKMMAINSLGNALAEGSSVYATDDDPELVWDAVPFGLKTIEGLIEESPRHKGLLLAATSGFTQYAYGSLQQEADVVEDADLARATVLRDRAKRLYLRARDYGLRGLDVSVQGFSEQVRRDRDTALGRLRREQVPLLYWTAAAWALAISNGKADMGLVAELPAPVAMMERALALDEAWDEGAVHEFFVTFDATRSAAEGGGADRAKAHLERALALSMNKKLGPRVSWAEGVLVQRQDRAEFTRVLEEVLRADPGEVPRYRLANVLAQRRAKALLAHADDLFL